MLLSAVTLSFNRPARDILPKLSRPLILFDHNDDHYAVLIIRQPSNDID